MASFDVLVQAILALEPRSLHTTPGPQGAPALIALPNGYDQFFKMSCDYLTSPIAYRIRYIIHREGGSEQSGDFSIYIENLPQHFTPQNVKLALIEGVKDLERRSQVTMVTVDGQTLQIIKP